jgi:hypothetical protein
MKNERFAFLLPRMRQMFRNLEAIGVFLIVGPEEATYIVRKPTMSEFRDAALRGGIPEPRSWIDFYELTFGDYNAEEKTEAIIQ